MSPEFWVGLVAVFVSGGAIGSAGTLLAQWLVKKVDRPQLPRQALDGAEVEVLRTEVTEMGRHMRNLDARLDFTERLLDGALPLSPPPSRLDDPGGGTADGGAPES
jgi:hypothetical protein